MDVLKRKAPTEGTEGVYIYKLLIKSKTISEPRKNLISTKNFGRKTEKTAFFEFLFDIFKDK